MYVCLHFVRLCLRLCLLLFTGSVSEHRDLFPASQVSGEDRLYVDVYLFTFCMIVFTTVYDCVYDCLQVQSQNTVTCSQLHKRAERIGCMLMEKGKLNTGDHVALVYPPSKCLVYPPSKCLVYPPSKCLVYQPSKCLVYQPSKCLVYPPSKCLVYQPSNYLVYPLSVLFLHQLSVIF